MLYRADRLTSFKLEAKDGDIGEVKDFYFDDVAWMIRYVVASTSRWLSGRKVLLSPESIGDVDVQRKHVRVDLTKDQVETSPSIDEEQTVSRTYEARLREHYGWSSYWSDPLHPGAGVLTYPVAGGAGAFPYPMGPAIRADPLPQEVHETELKTRGEDKPYLRGVEEVKNYKIRADDGEIGHIQDFLVDLDDNWRIRHLVIDTHNWLPERDVVVDIGWLLDFDWSTETARVALPKRAIEAAPELGKGVEVSQEFEQRLYDYYQKLDYGDRTGRERDDMVSKDGEEVPTTFGGAFDPGP